MKDAAAGERERHSPWPNLRRLLLATGFLAVAVALLLAWDAPAHGYEVSIYAATPTPFWSGIAIALLASLLVCGIYPRDRVALYGLALASLAVLAVASLPLVRAYRYYGASDAMTHLGYAEDARAGLIGPLDLLYPGGHHAAVLVGEGLRLSTDRAMLVFVAILLGTFVLFIPLVARAIVRDPVVTLIAGFSGLLLLPFNNVSVVYQFHAYSLGVMLLPVFAFVLVKHLRSGAFRRSPLAAMGGWNALLVLVGAAMLLLHPQVKLNLLILLGTFAAVHLVSRRRHLDHPLSRLRPTYASFVMLTLLWVAWSFQHWQPFAAFENLLGAAYFTVTGEQQAGQAAAEAGVSTGELGASLTELFLKLFLVPALFSLLATVVVAVAILATVRARQRQDYSVITYVGCGGIVLGPFFFLHFLGDVSQYFFRHLGFAMVFVTVLGALGIYYLAGGIAGVEGSPSLRVVGVWLLVVGLILTVPVLFASPYIYLPSGHISDGEASGYEKSFEIADGETSWTGVRSGPGRFFDGLTPDTRPARASGASTSDDEELLTMIGGGATEDRYLPVSERTYQREVIAYQEIRYEEATFRAVHRSPRTNHVYDNGEFDLYYVHAGE